MKKKIPYQLKIVISTIVFTIVVLFLCWLSYSLYTPKYEQRLAYVQETRTQRSSINSTYEAISKATQDQIATRTMEVELTEVKNTEIAYEYLSQTQTAFPTNTATATQTATPTSTPTPTPQPEMNLCPGKVVNRGDVKVYDYPNLAMVNETDYVEPKQEISIIGRLQDDPWVLVLIDGQESWMLSSTIDLDQNCKPDVYDLSYLLGEAETNRTVLIDDTFSSNQYDWIDLAGNSVFPSTDNLGNDQIQAETYGAENIFSQKVSSASISDFRLITSFSCYGYDVNQAYVGVAFGVNGSNLLSVGLTSTCQLRVEKNDQILFEKNLDNSICSTSNYYMQVERSESGELSITINASQPFYITLPPEISAGIEGQIGYEVRSSNAYFDFLVLTTAR